MNLDVRLIQVNERMVKHKLLVAVADWVQSCTGNMQVVLVKSTQTVKMSCSICCIIHVFMSTVVADTHVLVLSFCLGNNTTTCQGEQHNTFAWLCCK